MAGDVRTREGYLVIADIAGYTSFLTGTELEHAQAIIEELTALIRAQLVPPLRFVKLEGDAVFCYAESPALTAGERLVELIETCYFAFTDRLFNMVRATTCTCAACASIDALDLKFIAHYGEFVVQRDGRNEDVAGPDVILVHRLLKNSIAEATGIDAYAFFTDACMQRLPSPFDLPRHAESYESLGETSGGVHDLAAVARAMRDARREYVTADEADAQATLAVPSEPAVVWQYLIDPVQRLRWACVLMNRDPDKVELNARGRSGAGSKVHCNHGLAEAFREVTDWRPFSYFTTRGTTQFRGGIVPAREIIETFELTPQDGGTQVTWRLRFADRGRLSMFMLRILSFLFRGSDYGEAKLRAALEQDGWLVVGPRVPER